MKFKTFPSPKYLRIKKKERVKEIINPRREWPKSSEKVKRSAKNKFIKNIVTAPDIVGLIK